MSISIARRTIYEKFHVLAVLLTATLAMQGMEFDAITHEFNKIMSASYEHNKCLPKILLENDTAIGYGDSVCIESLNDARIPAQPNSPLITIRFEIPTNITQIAQQQADSNNKKIKELLYAMPKKEACSHANNYVKLQRHNKKMIDNAKEYQSLLKSTTGNIVLMPIEHLESITTLNPTPNTQLSFIFDEKQQKKLEVLKKEFKTQPRVIFLTLPETMASWLNFSYGNTDSISEEQIDDLNVEIFTHIIPAKQELRINEIIKRKPFGPDDWQSISDKTLYPTSIIEHVSNYHNHGENGYSEEKYRKTSLENKLDGQPVFEFINERELGKRRKMNNGSFKQITQ